VLILFKEEETTILGFFSYYCHPLGKKQMFFYICWYAINRRYAINRVSTVHQL